VVQTISYLPHFLSWIIVTGILHDMLSGTGIVNEVLVNLHIIKQPINFFAHTSYFWPIVAFAIFCVTLKYSVFEFVVVADNTADKSALVFSIV
jgi:ABC-type polysaccharide transport system permease subunit